METWEKQEGRYPQRGEPNSIQQILVAVYDDPTLPMDVLLYYDADGKLAGTLTHARVDIPAPHRMGVPRALKGDLLGLARPDLNWDDIQLILCRRAVQLWDDLDPNGRWNVYPEQCRQFYKKTWLPLYPDIKPGKVTDTDYYDKQREH